MALLDGYCPLYRVDLPIRIAEGHGRQTGIGAGHDALQGLAIHKGAGRVHVAVQIDSELFPVYSLLSQQGSLKPEAATSGKMYYRDQRAPFICNVTYLKFHSSKDTLRVDRNGEDALSGRESLPWIQPPIVPACFAARPIGARSCPATPGS